MTDVRTARPRSNRFPVLVAAAILVATASAPAIASLAMFTSCLDPKIVRAAGGTIAVAATGRGRR